MSATEMELRVAFAIYHPPVDDAERERIAKMHPHLIEDWLKVARKAIRAMREPTLGMIADGGANIAIKCQGFSQAARIANYSSPEIMRDNDKKALVSWEAMIDAASPPPSHP